MATLERPKLRPLSGRRVEHQGQAFVLLEDPLGVADEGVVLPLNGFQHVVRHFDGNTTLVEIQARVLRETGQLIHAAELETLVKRLDEAMILDGPAYADFVQNYAHEHTRPAAFAGRSYAGTERALRTELGRYFEGASGPGTPNPAASSDAARIRAILSPHIDFGRGGTTYSWAYRELVERTDADTFVIFGVAHQYTNQRFVLTRKDFETPLGLARTDRSFVDRVVARTGEHLFEDELVHKGEHSIEFQVVFLQYLLGPDREFSIVPILVGSFHDLMLRGVDPIDDPEVRSLVDAVREAEAASKGKVAYIGGIDLCHVGPEFGDPAPVDDFLLSQVRGFDQSMLARATAGDALGWFQTAGAIENRLRVCGLAATYTMLQAIGPVTGKVLKYDQAVNGERTCCVSFASVAYDATNP